MSAGLLAGCSGQPTASPTPLPSTSTTTTTTTTSTPAPPTTTTTTTQSAPTTTTTTRTAPPTTTTAPPTKPTRPTWLPADGSLTPVIAAFAKRHKGSYSVVVMEPTSGAVLADYRGATTYFTASIYKLYVAYAGYRALDAGRYSGNAPAVNSYTRAQCLDLMIRSSYSPCGVRWWIDLGRAKLDAEAKTWGLTDTDLVGLTTSAQDAARMLRLVSNGTGLSARAHTAYLDSMRTQPAKYRVGLPAGMPGLTVYNKVGWNVDLEWHDAAIVEVAPGRRVIVSIFTHKAGRANVVALARTIRAALPR